MYGDYSHTRERFRSVYHKKHYCLIWLSKTSQPGMKQQDFSDTKYQSFIEQYLFVDLDNKSFQGFKMEDVHFDDTSGKSTES